LTESVRGPLVTGRYVKEGSRPSVATKNRRRWRRSQSIDKLAARRIAAADAVVMATQGRRRLRGVERDEWRQLRGDSYYSVPLIAFRRLPSAHRAVSISPSLASDTRRL